MLEVARRNNPVRTNWVNRVCGAIRDNAELRRRFGITNMLSFRSFVRRQGFSEIRAAVLALEAGRTSTLLYQWQREQSRDEPQQPLRRSPARTSELPDSQLHLLPFWAGVRGFNL